MDLGGIALVILVVVLGLGLAAGTLAWMMHGKDTRQQANQDQVWPEEFEEGEELPPREDAWKPAIWYSEAAKGTLFPNQPSPSFRIAADSSFQRAISRRDLEAMTADGPTEPVLRASDPLVSPAVDRQLNGSIPDEVENVSEVPTQTLPSIPVKDNLPPTLKLRSVGRRRTTYPLPDAVVEAVSAAMMEMPSEPDTAPEDSASSAAYAPDEELPSPVTAGSEADWELDTTTGMEEVETTELVTSPPYMSMEEDTSPMAVADTPVMVEQVDTEQVDTSKLVTQPPLLPMEEADTAEPEPEPPAEPGEIDGPIESNEERYERLMVEAYSQVIHVAYDEDFNAVLLTFSGCPIRQNSDVPWVFKTISRKIQDIFARATWHQHALLLDVARLQVAPEAQAAWEMVLDGFVAQSCPEVTPYAVLAIQFDSSSPANETPESAEASHDLQLASSVTGQKRPLIQAASYEAAVLLLQMLRTEL